MPSYTDILTEITQANQGSTGLVNWTGTNGERQILLDLNTRLRDIGVLYVENTISLNGVTGESANLVFLKGGGLYLYNPTLISPLPTGAIPAGDGGTWVLLTNYGNKYNYSIPIIDTFTYTINHNLGYLYPNVRVIDITSSSNNFALSFDNVKYNTINQTQVTVSSSYAGKTILIIFEV